MSPGKMESDEVIWVNGRSVGLTDSESTQKRIAKMPTPITATAETAVRQRIRCRRDEVPPVACVSKVEGESASEETTAVALAEVSRAAESISCTGAMNRYPRFARVSM